jgi:hypothetical protein
VTVNIEEYTGMAPGNRPERFQGVPQLGTTASVTTPIPAGGAVSTISLQPNTQFIALMGGSVNSFYIYGGSSTASTAAGSTYFVPPNTQILRGVKPNAKLFAWST